MPKEATRSERTFWASVLALNVTTAVVTPMNAVPSVHTIETYIVHTRISRLGITRVVVELTETTR